MQPAEYLDMQALKRNLKSILYLSNRSINSILWRNLSHNEKTKTVKIKVIYKSEKTQTFIKYKVYCWAE